MGVCSERRKLFTFLFFSKRETEDLSVVESFDEDRRRRYGGLCLSCLYVWLAEAVGLRREGRDFSFFPAEISYKMRTIASSKFQVPSISSSPPLPSATSDYFTLSPVEGPMS